MIGATLRAQMSSASDEPRPGASEPGSDGRLDSWKEIAAYLRRSVRSAKRWEKEEGLPVHRHLHGKRDSVYAHRTELDGWWKNRGAKVIDQKDAEDATSPLETKKLVSDFAVEEGESVTDVRFPSPRAPSRAALIAVGLALATLLVGLIAVVPRNRSNLSVGSRPLPFKARDWVLITDFDNKTGEPLLDGTLDHALARALANSRYVNVVPRARVVDALRLMRKPVDTRVDAAVGREVCLRDGEIRNVLTGRIQKFGTKYLLSVDIVEPKLGTTISGFAEESDGPDGTLAAVNRISDRVRTALGEARASGEAEVASLSKVTTPNLRALQLFSRADNLLMTLDPRAQPAAEELLRQAVAEDPAFGMAWIYLAWSLWLQQKPPAEVRSCAETALSLAEATTEHERYFIRAGYYRILGETDKARAAWEALVALYPDDYWASQNLCVLYDWQHDPADLDKAAQIEARLADLRPQDFWWNCQAAMTAFFLKPDASREARFFPRASKLITPENRESFPEEATFVDTQPFLADWLRGDVSATNTEVDRVAATIDSRGARSRDVLARRTVEGYMMLGRLKSAAEISAKIDNPGLQNALLTEIAFLKGKEDEVRHRFQSRGPLDLPEDVDLTLLILQARAGIIARSRSFLETHEGASRRKEELHMLRGEIALSRGHLADAVRELEAGWESQGRFITASFYLGRESLAAILATRGDFSRAIQILERRPERREATFAGGAAYWHRNRLQLAELYRRVGRIEDARTVEAEVAKLLAFADADHPILLELQRLPRS